MAEDKTTIGDLLASWDEMETVIGPAKSDICSYNDGYCLFLLSINIRLSDNIVTYAILRS